MSRELRSQLGAFVGPTGGDAGLVRRYAELLRNAGGALLSPEQMSQLSPKARAEIDAALDKALGKKRDQHGRK